LAVWVPSGIANNHLVHGSTPQEAEEEVMVLASLPGSSPLLGILVGFGAECMQMQTPCSCWWAGAKPHAWHQVV